MIKKERSFEARGSRLEIPQSKKPKRWFLRDTSDIERIKFIFFFGFTERNSWMKKFLIPPGLTRISESELDYLAHRTDETLRKGGSMDPEVLSKQRPGIIDTGTERTPGKGLNWVKGALTVYKSLIDDGWGITDLKWIKKVTQQRKADGYGLPFKDQVIVEVSKNTSKEMKLSEEQMIVIERDLRQAWQYFHEWDDSHNKEMVLSFTGRNEAKYHSLGWIITLPRKPST